MLDRNRRHVEPEHATGLARVVAGGTDDVLGSDVARDWCEPPFARRGARDGGDLGLLVDLARRAARAPLRSAIVRSAGAMWPSSGW